MIQLRTLGGIGLRGSDGVELRAVLAQPKRLALLTYLALARPRGPQRRDRLIALFWPEQDSERARNALSQAIFFLRRELGGDVLVNRNGDELALDGARLWCDAIALEDASKAGRHDEVVELYRGELLAGLHVPDASPELEQWLESERARQAALYAEALELLAEEREHAGDHRGAVLWWRRVAGHDPYSARVALRLMRALAAAGDRVGAIQHARIYETLILNEVESQPDPQVTALAQALQSGAAPHGDEPSIARAALREGELQQPVTSKLSPALTTRFKIRRRSALVAISIAALLIAGALVIRLRSASAAPVIKSIAVLPFEEYSNDPRQDFVGESMTDAVITELARIPQLLVISRQSVLQFKGSKTPIPAIARALGVDGLVEGTVLRDGNRIRVNAQLISTRNERHIWAQHFDRDIADVVSLEDELSDAIARAVHTATAADSGRRQRRHYDPVVQGLYIRGEYAMLTRTPMALRQAIDFFREAVTRDSTFAPGYAGISVAYGLASDLGFMPQGASNDSVKVYFRRALSFDSTLSEAHANYGGSLSEGGDFISAEREFKRAIELDENNALAHHYYSMLLATLGRGAEAVAENARAEELDPLAAPIRVVGGRIRGYFHAPHIPGRTAKTPVDVDPTNAWARMGRANILAQQKQCAEARTEIDKAAQDVPNNIRMRLGQASVKMWCGDRKGALATFDSVKHMPWAHIHGYYIAAGFLRLGNVDSAFVWLDSTSWNVEQRFSFRTDRAFDKLKTDPRYERVVRRMGLAL